MILDRVCRYGFPVALKLSGPARALLVGSASLTLSVASADVVRNPVNAGIALEMTQIFDANYYGSLNLQAPVTMMRPTGWLFQSATVNERIDLVFGLGATTFSLPRADAQPAAGYQNELFPAVALVQASGSYTWGDLKAPMLKVTFGQIPYKYNSDANELGEYLIRSTPYPSTVLNSPFNLVRGAQATVLGGVVSKNFADGKWKNDLLITSANSSYPLYDFGLAYVTSYKFNPIFELGAGANLVRLISVDDKVTTPHDPKFNSRNAYFEYNGKDYTTFSGYYYNKKTAADSLAGLLADSVAANIEGTGPLPAGVSGIEYYTFKGQSLMARFSVDFKPILGEKVDLKLYGEWAMLGVQNYPIFFDKPENRMPMMVGLNIPTWGVLDRLNVEAEYWKNPYFNSDVSAYLSTHSPVPLDGPSFSSYSNAGLSPDDAVKDDDMRWSVSATKSFGKAFSLTAKAANDHLQVMELSLLGFPGRTYGDIMSTKSAWYYVLRAQMAI